MKAHITIILFAVLSSFKVQSQLSTGIHICDQVPELNYWNQDSTAQIAESSLRGKIVLVDFWASWCGSCRLENPYLVKTYKKYKNTKFGAANGFEIYSVSLDYRRNYWVAAINHDSLCWHSQVSDLKGWNSQAAVTYSINAIPANFLLDENGMIIGENFLVYTGKLDSLLNALSQSPQNNSKLTTPPLTLQMYPNPASTEINLKISKVENFKIVDIEIYNTMGECVKQFNVQDSKLNIADSIKIYNTKGYCNQSQTFQLTTCQMEISDLNEGIYIMNINSNQSIITKRLAIIK